MRTLHGDLVYGVISKPVVSRCIKQDKRHNAAWIIETRRSVVRYSLRWEKSLHRIRTCVPARLTACLRDTQRTHCPAFVLLPHTLRALW